MILPLEDRANYLLVPKHSKIAITAVCDLRRVNLKSVNVIGLGYIGLPTALIFANSGIKVVGTDCNENLVDSLSHGKITFEEHGLEELLKNALDNGIEFTTEYQKADTYIIAVPTPYVNSSKRVDPKYIIAAVNAVLDVCNQAAILIIESTVSPRTIDRHVRPEIEKRGFVLGEDVHLVHAPERIFRVI